MIRKFDLKTFFSQIILENWINMHQGIGKEDLLKKLELVFTSLRRYDIAYSIKTSIECVKQRRREEVKLKRREEDTSVLNKNTVMMSHCI